MTRTDLPILLRIRSHWAWKTRRRLTRELDAARADVATARDEKVAARRDLVEARAEISDLNQRLADALHRGGDPAARRLVGSIMQHKPFNQNCGIGAGDRCIVHFGEVHCSVAWLKNWSSGLTATDGIVPLANVMTNRPEAPHILAAALNEWADAHEVAGAEGTDAEAAKNRSSVRLARHMAHAVRSQGI